VSAALLAAGSGYAAAAVFSISSPQFSAYVNPDSYEVITPAGDGIISRSKLTRGRLYFSLTVVGSRETLSYLEKKLHLELSGSIWCDGQRLDTVQFGMSPREWDRDRPALETQLDNEGLFRWRTYMYTRQIHCSTIEIILRDGTGQGVRPIGHSGMYSATVQLVN
jgi:hypothetical protein